MNIAEIESGLKELSERPFNRDSFIFDFFALYDVPKATITKLKQGSSNSATQSGDILWKKKFFYRAAKKGQSAPEVEKMLLDPLTKKHAPRFLFATDGIEFFARDLKTEVTYDARFDLLNNSFDFFLPLAGIERYEGVAENPADIKATARLAKLYDAILEANPSWTSATHTHELNIFMTRMLFCFFAEDTSIFDPALFTSTLLTLTKEDGSDTAKTIDLIFDVMNLPDIKRSNIPAYAMRFPYVNGGLFATKSHVPTFSPKARRILKECGSLVWREINPDIFGSMIQAVVEPEMRGDMGMHYTSVPNIMKVLQPIFLISLEEDFEAAKKSESKLRKLLERMYKIRVFDPACGSGNFLIIAYKELRKLESRIFERLKEVSAQATLQMTGIRLSQFFGIELADFATETAKLSLWIAEYQMNELFKAQFGSAPPSLPLRECGNIVHGNACQLDWMDICSVKEGVETFVVGNPPYLGRAQQSASQKNDMEIAFSGVSTAYKNLDYVSIWVIKGSAYCKAANAQCAFVTTNSICQGEQVALLWPLVLNKGLEIGFAHQSFKWKNNASANAGVTCVIVGIRKIQKTVKRLFSDELGRTVKNISPYLIEGDNLIVAKRSSPLSNIPNMDFGSMPNDDGNLILSTDEKKRLIHDYPNSKKFIKSFVGSQEFIKGSERYCLWIPDKDLNEALEIKEIAQRISQNKKYRKSSTRAETRELAATPNLFGEIRYREANAIIVPGVSSERRPYLTIGIVDKNTVISNAAFAIYGAPTYLFSILSSRLHLVWTASVGGQLESRLRYSATLIYNTFPIPEFTQSQKMELESFAMRILILRESYIGKTIAELYDAESMPDDLRACHIELDDMLESVYFGRPFKNDSDRLQFLFSQYFFC
jgi:hypothetical protein